jgi:hypothetical protein
MKCTAYILVIGLLLVTSAAVAEQDAPECTITGQSSVQENVQEEETACSDVVHIGDSTSEGLEGWHQQRLTNVEPQYPCKNPFDLISVQYKLRGVANYWPEISSNRHIIEHYTNQLNAIQVVEQRTINNYHGCWVVAIGLNDSSVVEGDLQESINRIELMMSSIGNDPVMWVNNKTATDKSCYRDQYMKVWNQALSTVCEHHPNMRIYDWASEAKLEWYVGDRVHFTEQGDGERAVRIARALARAFPRNGSNSSACVVRGD